jgi:competence protein ComEC
MSKKDEKTSSGIDKGKLKLVLAVAVIVIPAIAIGAYATGLVGGGGSGGGGESPAENEGGQATSGEAEVVVADVVYDPEGAANEEDVVFENTGGSAADMSGWTVEDEAGTTYTFPNGFTLGPGESVTLNVEEGTDTDTDLYWGYGRAIWNNGGDTVILRDSSGAVVLEESY